MFTVFFHHVRNIIPQILNKGTSLTIIYNLLTSDYCYNQYGSKKEKQSSALQCSKFLPTSFYSRPLSCCYYKNSPSIPTNLTRDASQAIFCLEKSRLLQKLSTAYLPTSRTIEVHLPIPSFEFNQCSVIFSFYLFLFFFQKPSSFFLPARQFQKIFFC